MYEAILPQGHEYTYWNGKKVPLKHFNIVAISIRIVYNEAGDHDPNGLMYVLKENEDKIRAAVAEKPFNTIDLVQPLVIRANLGDFIIVDFENKLGRRASIHIQDVKYDVLDSDGAAVGFNPDTTTGGRKKYCWYADKEGIFMFHDMADTRSGEDATNVHGLFGALIVEPVGATWTDPINGIELKSGCYADIHHPALSDFREYVTVFHDEPEIKDRNGNTPISPETGQPESTMPINYRAEPMRNRHPHCPRCAGEEVSLSSWPFGDPATPILRAYVGDPAKIRVIHGGIKETHVFHLHNHQWLLEPNDPKSTIVDSISFSPQQCMTIEPLFGAGSLNGCIGDVIWHCHLYPHFAEGMWGLWRILDRLEDGTIPYPDGTTIPPRLLPLPDRTPPPLPDDLHPGFPRFVAGVPGEKAFKPPLGIIGQEARLPTQLEEENFVANAVPGALYSNPCPPDAPVKVFEVVAIQLPIVYNSQEWKDPEGRIFVLKDDKEAVMNGQKEPEPFVIRANVGDCIEIRLTNELPLKIGGNAFQIETDTTEAGWHIHLVKFDTIVADGSANGWCNDASAIPGDTLIERFYADTELRTVFFHDHLFPNSHQQHGLFGALIIEPPNSTYHDPESGDKIQSGTKAVIRIPGQPDFREFVLAVHDFAFLFDKEKPLNPPSFPSVPDDPGVMGINYKCEPLQFRKGDPAYVFSSYVHGDPVTPLLETYEGDPIRIRLFDGAQEEQHSFNLHGLRWRKEPTDAVSPLIQSQTLGISEAFNIEINYDYKKGDYLYYFGGVDDLWLGLWGILRVHDEKVPHLLPLVDRPVPPNRTEPLPQKTGNPPPKAPSPGNICPVGANFRKYEVVAIQKDIVYNKFGDHDPNGLMFVLKEHEGKVLQGNIKPKPLILRANAGDCIEVTLTNHLYNPIVQDTHPEVPVDAPFPPSNRASIHAQLLKYDVLGSDGATIGFNYDQTVAPGESITYRWFADSELGACTLTGFADIRNHRHHGLFGAIIIEPTGSRYLDEKTGQKLKYGELEQVVISNPGMSDFREFVIFMQDGISLYDKEDNLIPDPHTNGHGGEGLDFEDQGQKGFNYRSERFENRLQNVPNAHLVMSSNTHGDPATPVFKAYPGDPVRIRLIMPADKPRNHSFVLHGHSWRQQFTDPLSDIISCQGAISVGNVFNLIIEKGASQFAGDYAYRSGLFRWDVEQGMWGIFRIFGGVQCGLLPINGNDSFNGSLVWKHKIFMKISNTYNKFFNWFKINDD